MAKLRNEPLRDFCALKSGSPVRGGLRASGFVGFDLDSVLFFVYAFFLVPFFGVLLLVFLRFSDLMRTVFVRFFWLFLDGLFLVCFFWRV